MHLHGFNMYVLDEGDGDWNGTVVMPQNPLRRDVVQLRKNGYLVVQFDAGENPGEYSFSTAYDMRDFADLPSCIEGVWPFHCHIAWHASAGLFTQFVAAGDKLKKLKSPPPYCGTNLSRVG